MDALSPWRLSIMAAVVVLALSVALITVLGGTAQAAPYLAFIAPTIVAFMALLRSERNAEGLRESRDETTEAIEQLAQAHKHDGALTLAKIQELNAKLGDPLHKPVPQPEDHE